MGLPVYPQFTAILIGNSARDCILGFMDEAEQSHIVFA